MIENTSTSASLNTIISRNKGMEESMQINGYVTVIKNAGKDNEEIICQNKPNLLTNSGRDWMHAQIYTNTAAGDRGAGYIALTTNTGTPAATDTALTGEITTGGLERADASSKSHSAGTNTTTIQNTFTASATHTAVVKAGLFNAASSGTMAHVNTFTSVTLASSDTLEVTWTITLG
mgnify:FL=1|jgi:hypothetical protein|tara:strand:+ start:3640 stop:4170 length:531 start_codon:yes stop_codon:yes gene_type:complete